MKLNTENPIIQFLLLCFALFCIWGASKSAEIFFK